jgi:hypothetical protein
VNREREPEHADRSRGLGRGFESFIQAPREARLQTGTVFAPPSRMRVVTIYAHHNPRSFCHAILESSPWNTCTSTQCTERMTKRGADISNEPTPWAGTSRVRSRFEPQHPMPDTRQSMNEKTCAELYSGAGATASPGAHS